MTITPVDLRHKKILVTGPTSQVALPVMAHLVTLSDKVYGLSRFSKEKDRKKNLTIFQHELFNLWHNLIFHF